nr:MAG TPA: hypothetical protein [Caudoviricetes sp.]
MYSVGILANVDIIFVSKTFNMSILGPSYCSRWSCTRSIVIIICFTSRLGLCRCVLFNSYCIVDLSNCFLCSIRSC